MRKALLLTTIYLVVVLFITVSDTYAGASGYGWARKLSEGGFATNLLEVRPYRADTGAYLVPSLWNFTVGALLSPFAFYSDSGCSNTCANGYDAGSNSWYFKLSGFPNVTNKDVILTTGDFSIYLGAQVPYNGMNFSLSRKIFQLYLVSGINNWQNQIVGTNGGLNGQWYQSPPTYKIKVRPSSDLGSIVTSIILWTGGPITRQNTLIGNCPTSNCWNGPFPQTVTVDAFSDLIDGWYTYYFFTGDNSGATTSIAGAEGSIGAYGIDSQDPSASCSTSWLNNSTLRVARNSIDSPTGSGVDPGSGVLEYRTSTDGGSTWSAWTNTGNTATFGNYDLDVGSNNTLKYNFRFSVYDLADNEGQVVCWLDPAPPDLIVDSITPNENLVTGQTITFTARVYNLGGTAVTPTFGTWFSLDTNKSLPYATEDFNLGVPPTSADIAVGGYVDITSSSSWTATAGTHTIRVFTDSGHQVAESTDTDPPSGNNFLDIQFVVANPTPTPTPGAPSPPATPTPTSTPTPTPIPPTPTPTPPGTYTISGNVFVDDGTGDGGTANNGAQDGTEPLYLGSTPVNRSGTSSGSTNTSGGAYSFSSLSIGTYSITLTVPAGYLISPGTVNPRNNIALPPTTPVHFGIILVAPTPTAGPTPTPVGPTPTAGPTYTISGNVFVDNDKDGLKNGAETNWTGSITITSLPAGTVSYPNPGEFTVSSLAAGTYRISYTGLPLGYQKTYPSTGPPPYFDVTVGSSCSIGGSNSAVCSGGSITNLNYGIALYGAWIQSTGTDIRLDNGFDYYIPATPICGGPYASIIGSGGTPGIIFTGDSNAIFGLGSASSKNWVVGGISYPELFTPSKGNVIRTSYSYMNAQIKQAGLTATTLPASCNNSSGCSLSALAHGLYSNATPTPQPIYITASNMTCKKDDLITNGNCVFLINGDIHIQGNIIVPVGATATFISSGNIYVDSSIGNALLDYATPIAQVQGYYSTDKSFIIQGTNNCSVETDRRLNIGGSVVVNAGFTGGTFQNRRNLCAGNSVCPVFSIQERPDFILNAPDLIRYRDTIYREIAP